MAAIFKIKKSRYFQNHLADFDEIFIAMHISHKNKYQWFVVNMSVRGW